VPTKNLTNLLKAGGLTTPVANDSFATDMPGATLPAGRSFKDYLLSSLTLVSKSFVVGFPPLLSYTTITWNIARNVAGATNKLQDLGPRVTTLTFENVLKDDGSSSAGNVYYYSLTVNYTTTDIQITAQIASARNVGTGFGTVGSGNAYESFTIKVTHKPDNDLFNDPGITFYDDVQVRPLITGQGGPATAPAAPTWNTTFGVGPGGNDVRFNMFAAWDVAISTWEVRFSTASDMSVIVATQPGPSPAYGVYVNASSGAFYGNQTIYAQARVTAPYTTPWSSTVTMTWNDTRPP
jgi:hypothetical protein